jgi:hypothetical protein
MQEGTDVGGAFAMGGNPGEPSLTTHCDIMAGLAGMNRVESTLV